AAVGACPDARAARSRLAVTDAPPAVDLSAGRELARRPEDARTAAESSPTTASRHGAHDRGRADGDAPREVHASRGGKAFGRARGHGERLATSVPTASRTDPGPVHRAGPRVGSRTERPGGPGVARAGRPGGDWSSGAASGASLWSRAA